MSCHVNLVLYFLGTLPADYGDDSRTVSDYTEAAKYNCYRQECDALSLWKDFQSVILFPQYFQTIRLILAETERKFVALSCVDRVVQLNGRQFLILTCLTLIIPSILMVF
jgi:hypothetical protein